MASAWRADVPAFHAYTRLCLEVEHPPEVLAAYEAALLAAPPELVTKDVRQLVLVLFAVMERQNSPHRYAVLETALGDRKRALRDPSYMGGVVGLLRSIYDCGAA